MIINYLFKDHLLFYFLLIIFFERKKFVNRILMYSFILYLFKLHYISLYNYFIVCNSNLLQTKKKNMLNINDLFLRN